MQVEILEISAENELLLCGFIAASEKISLYTCIACNLVEELRNCLKTYMNTKQLA